MFAAALLIGVLAFAFIVGAGSMRLYRLQLIPLHYFQGRGGASYEGIVLAALAGAACVFATQYLFALGKRERPATDSPVFQQQQGYSLSRSGPASAGPGSLKGSYLVALDVMDKTPVHNDVRVKLSYKPYEIIAGGTLVKAELVGPSQVEMRTADRCPPQSQGSGQNVPASNKTEVAACEMLSQPSTEVDLNWQLTPNDTGRFLFALNIAGLGVGGLGGDSSVLFNVGTEVRTLSERNPVAKIGDVQIDMSHQQLSFPLQVLNTLGVTQETYDLLELIGKVLAFLFGSGVLLKIAGIIWHKVKPADNDNS
jgi:hypothetical protein